MHQRQNRSPAGRVTKPKIQRESGRAGRYGCHRVQILTVFKFKLCRGHHSARAVLEN